MSEPAFQKGDRVRYIGEDDPQFVGTVWTSKVTVSHNGEPAVFMYLVAPDEAGNPDWCAEEDLAELDAITRLGEVSP